MWIELQQRTSATSSVAIAQCDTYDLSLGLDGIYITVGEGLFDHPRKFFFDYRWFNEIYEITEKDEFRLIWSDQ
jgi:hypothetical protein